GIRLMGFGHRVYKNYDPRARLVKKIADDVLERLGVNDSRLELAMELEEIALKDDYFVERKLYPNVDFYTGLIYKAIGFPTEMFTVLFAIGRLPGWIAQWEEMVHDPETKIGRPRQIYTGHAERPYQEMGERTGTSELRLAELQSEIEKRGGGLPARDATARARTRGASAPADQHHHVDHAVVGGTGHRPVRGRPSQRVLAVRIDDQRRRAGVGGQLRGGGGGCREAHAETAGPHGARELPHQLGTDLLGGDRRPDRIQGAHQVRSALSGQGRGEEPALGLVIPVGLRVAGALDLLGHVVDVRALVARDRLQHVVERVGGVDRVLDLLRTAPPLGGPLLEQAHRVAVAVVDVLQPRFLVRGRECDRRRARRQVPV